MTLKHFKASDRSFRTLQIALVGGANGAIQIGLRNFPVHKLILVGASKDREDADQIASDIVRVLGTPVEVVTLNRPDVRSMLEAVGSILSKEKDNFQDFIINLGGGDRGATCAAATAAFVYGIKAFDVMGGEPEMLPILKLSYSEVVSKAKLDILAAIDKNGGQAQSLEELSRITGYGKPLLSYHVNGGEDSKGLTEFGLVESDRGERGRTRLRITTLGKMLLLLR